MANWVYENKGVSDKDEKALEKAKQQEHARIKKGWKYFVINSRLKVLVPHKHGKPTEEGQRMIQSIKDFLRI